MSVAVRIFDLQPLCDRRGQQSLIRRHEDQRRQISDGQHGAGCQRNSVLIIGQHNRSRFPAVIYDLLAEQWGKAASGQRIAHGFALPRFQARVAAYQVGANRSKQASLLQSIDLLVALHGGGRVAHASMSLRACATVIVWVLMTSSYTLG